MKEILETLKVKFEGVSESVLRVTAKNLFNKGKSIEDVESITIQSIIEAHADQRASEASVTTRSKMEAEIKAMQTQPITGGEAKPTETTDEVPTWAKNLSEAVAKLQNEKVLNARSEKIKSIISNLPEEFQTPYSLAPIDSMDDQAFDMYIEKITPQVGAIAVKLSAQAASGVPTATGGKVEDVSEAMKQRLERKETEAANQVPATSGLGTK